MDRQENRANDSCVEVWSLHHPRYGLIEIRAGFDPDFARIHDDWPGKERAGHHLSAESSLKERINARRTTRKRVLRSSWTESPNAASTSLSRVGTACFLQRPQTSSSR